VLAAAAAGVRGLDASSVLRVEPLGVVGEGEEKVWWMRCSRRTQLRRVIAMAK
jgi:hypothetical protein